MKGVFRKWLPLLLLVLCLLLSGCNAIGLDVETQLTPPESSAEHEAIRAALNDYIVAHTQNGQSADYTLKYPSGGSYLSAFIMLDQVEKHTVLTGNPHAAALADAGDSRSVLAFYRRNDEDALVHINLLQSDENGEWISVADVEGKGESVNQVEFADLNNDGTPELLIGWSLYNTRDSRLTIYNIDEGLTARSFSDTYTKLVVADITADGGDDLLLLSIANGFDVTSVQMFSFKTNNVLLEGSALLDGNIVDFGHHVTAALSDDINGVFLDCYKEQDAMITELIVWDHEKLTTPLCGHEALINTVTARELPLACRDIDGDGVVEWPVTTRMPGFEETPVKDTLWYTEWCSYDLKSDSVRTKFSSLIPAREGYMLRLREEWKSYPAAYNAETSTLTLYLDADSGRWLFRIASFALERKDELPEGYVLIEEDKDTCYAVCLSENAGSVSLEEIRYLFNVSAEGGAV